MHFKSNRVRRAGVVLLPALMLLITGPTLEAAAARHPAASTTPSQIYLNFHFGKDIAIASVIIGAVAGVGVYLIVRKGPGITGCAVEGSRGLEMSDEADHRTYRLTGKLALVKAGQRMRVYGRKKGKTDPEFLVRKSPKIYGPCTDVTPVT